HSSLPSRFNGIDISCKSFIKQVFGKIAFASFFNCFISLYRYLELKCVNNNLLTPASLAICASMESTHKNLISVSIHTGVGAGIIIEEKLYHGFEGRSGEIGHTTLYPDGIACPCGN